MHQKDLGKGGPFKQSLLFVQLQSRTNRDMHARLLGQHELVVHCLRLVHNCISSHHHRHGAFDHVAPLLHLSPPRSTGDRCATLAATAAMPPAIFLGGTISVCKLHWTGRCQAPQTTLAWRRSLEWEETRACNFCSPNEFYPLDSSSSRVGRGEGASGARDLPVLPPRSDPVFVPLAYLDSSW
jgi:hypothetical protein